jgi:ATP phosphoribosyltransferase
MIEKICEISSKLIVNKASYKTKLTDMQNIINIFQQAKVSV